MKRTLIATTLALLPTLVSAQPSAVNWTKLAAVVRASMVNIESADGRCTGFIIDDERDFILTAAHCDGKELYADLAPTRVRAKDVKNDLMVLHVEGVDGPAMKLADKNPEIGEQVASYGFGAGWERPMFRLTHISDNNMTIPDIEGGPWIVLDAPFIGGQSGGAIFNSKGEVVSIVQRGTQGLGLGVGVEVIRLKMGRYFTGGK